MQKMSRASLTTLILIWLVGCGVTSGVANEVKDDLHSAAKESNSLNAKDMVGALAGRPPPTRQNPCGGNDGEKDRGKQGAPQTLGQLSSGKCASTSKIVSADAQRVWLAGKQALVEQLAEQLKDEEVAVNDEVLAVNSVKKCVQSAVSSGLEARQQAKIIKLLSSNSIELIEHIDRVEKVANDELVATEERLAKFQEKVENLRDRISKVRQELKGFQECGNMKTLGRRRRCEERYQRLVPRLYLRKRLAKKVVPAPRKWCSSLKAANVPEIRVKRGPLTLATLFPDPVKRDETCPPRPCGSPEGDNKAQTGENDGSKPKSIDAKAVWCAGRQALIDQLSEQLKEDEAAAKDEIEAVKSVKKCVDSSVSSGLEARQQAKIIELLEKNSKDLIAHVDRVEQVANEELIGTQERLAKFNEKVQTTRARLAREKQELVANQECITSGGLKPRVRRQVACSDKHVPARAQKFLWPLMTLNKEPLKPAHDSPPMPTYKRTVSVDSSRLTSVGQRS